MDVMMRLRLPTFRLMPTLGLLFTLAGTSWATPVPGGETSDEERLLLGEALYLSTQQDSLDAITRLRVLEEQGVLART